MDVKAIMVDGLVGMLIVKVTQRRCQVWRRSTQQPRGFEFLLALTVLAILGLAACNESAQALAGGGAPKPPKPPTPPAAAQIAAAGTDPLAAAKAAGTTAVCVDGSRDFSSTRSGACAGHTGVSWWTGKVGAAGPGNDQVGG